MVPKSGEKFPKMNLVNLRFHCNNSVSVVREWRELVVREERKYQMKNPPISKLATGSVHCNDLVAGPRVGLVGSFDLNGMEIENNSPKLDYLASVSIASIWCYARFLAVAVHCVGRLRRGEGRSAVNSATAGATRRVRSARSLPVEEPPR